MYLAQADLASGRKHLSGRKKAVDGISRNRFATGIPQGDVKNWDRCKESIKTDTQLSIWHNIFARCVVGWTRPVQCTTPMEPLIAVSRLWLRLLSRKRILSGEENN